MAVRLTKRHVKNNLLVTWGENFYNRKREGKPHKVRTQLPIIERSFFERQGRRRVE